MIRLKETIDEKVLEQYGFEKSFIWMRNNKGRWYRLYYFRKSFVGSMQSVEIYIEPFVGAYGQVVHNAREVVACQHVFNVDKAVNFIAKLLLVGIFEYVESEASKND